MKDSQEIACIGSFKADFTIGKWQSSDVLDKIFGIDKDFERSLVNWKNIVHPDESAIVEKFLNENVISKKQKFDEEYRIVRQNDREVKWVHGIGEVDFDANGKVSRMIGTIQDISEKKITEIKLKEKVERIKGLSQIIENSINEVFIFDIRSLKLYFINESAIKNLGYSKEKYLNLTMIDIKPEFTNESFLQNAKPLLTGEKDIIRFETFHQRKNGTKYPVEVNLQLSIFEGKEVFSSIVQNITERKYDEQKLKKQNELLTAKNIQLDDFCNIVSHNLRGPIVNISMLVDFIENSEDEKERNEILSKFKPVLSSLNESFNELVESLQVRNDHEIKSENIIVNDMLQKILAGMETEISTFGAKIEIDLNNSPTVHFPVKYMNSILFNLINNSLKYRSPLRNPIIKIKTEKINNKTILSISDNGIGIDLKMHKKNLFKIRKVFHEHPDAKGFGLFMTKTQVEAMGGKIWAESTPGIGTTFYIEFLKT